MSAQSLSNFLSELRTRNISRPNLYYVDIIPPGLSQSANKLVSMWCSSAHTPQVDIHTNDAYLENGTRRKYAYDHDYQNLVLTFYIDQDYEVKKFFDDWKHKIVSNKRNFGFPNDYTAESLNLYIINQEDANTYKYQYSRVFPKTIQQVELSYSSGIAVSSFSVEFVYEEVYISSLNAKTGTEITNKPVVDMIASLKDEFGNNELLQQISMGMKNDFKNIISGGGGDFGGGGASGDWRN